MKSNNDHFNSLLHLFGILDGELIIKIFGLGGMQISTSQIKAWRTTLENPRASVMQDETLEAFIQGVFSYRNMMRSQGVNVFNFPHNKK